MATQGKLPPDARDLICVSEGEGPLIALSVALRWYLPLTEDQYLPSLQRLIDEWVLHGTSIYFRTGERPFCVVNEQVLAVTPRELNTIFIYLGMDDDTRKSAVYYINKYVEEYWVKHEKEASKKSKDGSINLYPVLYHTYPSPGKGILPPE